MESLARRADQIFKDFSKLNSFKEKLQVFIGCEDVREFTRQNLSIAETEKDSVRSEKHRNRGNQFFKSKEDDKALSEYNAAVRWGASSDQTLSLALANRSAVLFRRREYKKSIDDIELALRTGYPDSLAYKIMERRARAFSCTGDLVGARTELERARETVNKSNLDGDRLESFLQTLENLSGALKPTLLANETKPVGGDPARSAKFGGFYDLVEVRSSSTAGRFLLSNRNIQVGEVIGSERPVGTVLLPEQVGERCDACLRPCSLAPVPCLNCSSALYCSLDCLERSRSCHVYECCVKEGISKHIVENKFFETFPNYFRLGFRILSAAPDLKGTAETFLGETRVDFSKPVEQRERDFSSLLNLCGWDGEIDLEKDFWIFILVVFYLEVLSEKRFYELTPMDPLHVGELLYRIIKILQSNSHSVMECAARQDGSEIRMETVGTALYSSMAFLNHSCDPNTVKYFEGDRLVLVALRPIRVGEEVTDNYGPHFSLSTRITRNNWLQDYYGFQCRCQACRENRPIFEHLPETVQSCLCTNCLNRGTEHEESSLEPRMELSGDSWSCSCGRRVPRLSLENKIKSILQRVVETSKMELMSGEYSRSVEEYKECIGDLYSNLRHPLKFLASTERAYSRALRMVYGNRKLIQ